VHTGRQLALLRDGLGLAAVRMLRNAAGLRIALSSDFGEGFLRAPLAPGEGVLFERLGAALLYADHDQTRALAAYAGQPVLALEPERFVRAHSLRDAEAEPQGSMPLLDDSPVATWGLEATRALTSRYSGVGVRVAILDTGLDLGHPDFAGRTVLAESFVAGLSVDDVNGHGTFCAGVACGPKLPSQGPRYGVACAADLCIARVLNDDAGGIDGNVLAGIEWAVRKDCAVICLSLGSPVAVGDSYPEVYEHVASRALAAGSLLIAPAGNESQRPDNIAPVEHPANCPSVVAVAALDRSLTVASFSNGGLNPDGGEVALAAPGIGITSAAPRPTLYQTGSGTSMAAPFVAGIAALLAEADLFARGARLRDLLLQSFVALSDPPRDVGAGLVQAPQ
jgi:subtilisin family serine protease